VIIIISFPTNQNETSKCAKLYSQYQKNFNHNCLTCTKPMEMVTRPLSSTSNTLQKIQYLNYITGIPVLYKILKQNHNTGTNFYTSIVHKLRYWIFCSVLDVELSGLVTISIGLVQVKQLHAVVSSLWSFM
jgi:hypothetical protein